MCDCIEKANEKLAEQNTRIVQRFTLTGVIPNVAIESERIEIGRGKPKAKAVLATYCPFCGVKYGGK